MATVLTVNLGQLRPIRSSKNLPTAIAKQPVDRPVEVRDPGPKHGGLGSGLVGDAIGDVRHHGGDEQAVYAYAREDLDRFETILGHPLGNGGFGENLTTQGLEVSDAVVGERWKVGESLVLQVTSPRIPCATFRAHIDARGWLKTFTRENRSGTYLSVVTAGVVRAGDPIEVVHRPDHGVRSSDLFAALLTDRDRLPSLLAAGGDLVPEARELALEAAARRRTS